MQNKGPAATAKGLTTVQVNAKPFGMQDKYGYMLGDIGNDAILGLVNSFLMIYYTNVLGIVGGVVGILYRVSRCIDSFSYFADGSMSDVTEITHLTRFLPWINRMKWSFCTVSLLIFAQYVSS